MPKGKGYGTPSTKIGKGDIVKKTGVAGKFTFLPNSHENGLRKSNKQKGTTATTSTTPYPFMPAKPK